jgi:predicted ATP-binding protein involved in virulence
LDSYTFEKQFPSPIFCSGVAVGQRITWSRELNREGGRTNTQDAKAISELGAEAERRVRAGEAITLPLICTYGAERLWFEKTHYARKAGEGKTGRKPSRLDGYSERLDGTIQETAREDASTWNGELDGGVLREFCQVVVYYVRKRLSRP